MNEEEFRNKHYNRNQDEESDSKNENPHKDKPRDIFTDNSYNQGEGLSDDYEFTDEIKASEKYASEYLQDIYDYDTHVDHNVVREQVMNLINSDQEIYNLIYNREKQKFNKEEANLVFSVIFEKFRSNEDLNNFLDPIKIFDLVSSITGVNHTKLFDYLEYKYREILIVELNKRYDFLNNEDKLF